MTTATKKPLTPDDLNNFTGTESYHRFLPFRQVLTDGVLYLINNGGNGNGAFWLATAILSHQTPTVRRETFQIWELTLDKDTDKTASGAVLTMRTDTGRPILVKQKIEYTDFEFSTKLYMIDGVLLLPSEY